MTRGAFALGIAAFTVIAAAGCASLGDATNAESGVDDPETNLGAGDADAETPPNASPSTQGATGVVLVHAARFPAFRICFGSNDDTPPLPASDLMPEANVVGVEVGSYIRLDEVTLGGGGDVYLFAEEAVRNKEASCSALIGGGDFVRDRDYQLAELRLPDGDDGGARTLGLNALYALALTGCGSSAFLNAIPPRPRTDDLGALCGPERAAGKGSLELHVIPLNGGASASGDASATKDGDETGLRLVNLAAVGDDDEIEVAFHARDDAADAPTPISVPALFEVGERQVIRFDRSNQPVYAQLGFGASVTSGEGEPMTTWQSLAEVQELSAPAVLPSDFFGHDSDYALFLIGDPAHTRTLPGEAGANPMYNRRLALHFLAMPLLDPSKGGEDGDPSDGGAPPGDQDAGPAGGGS